MSSALLPYSSHLERGQPVAPALPPARRRRTVSPAVWWFAALFVAYTVVGATFVFVADVLMDDALARVSLASQVLRSRDASLADIGFVWSPLPTLLLIPLLPLADLWPALLHEGFAANIVSAACMAGAVVVLLRLATDIGVPRAPRAAIGVLIAVHPMTVLYGANGMSEALGTLVAVLALHALHHWVTHHDMRQLLLAGTYLGVAYLVRYEAVAAAAGAAAAVAFVSLRRAGWPAATRESRRWSVWRWPALADVALLLFPVASAFGAWALFSWTIVGTPFQQFSSAYGLAANQAVMSAAVANGETGPTYVATQVLALAPLLGVAVAAVAWIAWRQRDVRPLLPLAVLGAPLAFTALSTASGLTFSLARYYQLVVPLVGAMAFWVAAAGAGAFPWCKARRAAGLVGVLLVGAGMLTAVPAVLGSWRTASGATLAPQEWSLVEVLRHGSAARNVYMGDLRGERSIAAALDDLRLPEGSVLVDAFLGYPIVVRSSDPRQFIVTADRDFTDRLADPGRFGVSYLLVPDPAAQGAIDQINRTYPELFAGGEPFAELAQEFPGGPNGRTWRLYRVLSAPLPAEPEVPAPVPGAGV